MVIPYWSAQQWLNCRFLSFSLSYTFLSFFLLWRIMKVRGYTQLISTEFHRGGSRSKVVLQSDSRCGRRICSVDCICLRLAQSISVTSALRPPRWKTLVDLNVFHRFRYVKQSEYIEKTSPTHRKPSPIDTSSKSSYMIHRVQKRLDQHYAPDLKVWRLIAWMPR